jgi:hypothetical protein
MIESPPLSPLLTSEQAAELADIKPAQLYLWLTSGKFTTDRFSKSQATGETIYYFTEDDIKRLSEFVAGQVAGRTAVVRARRKSDVKDLFIDNRKQENFTVAQIASLWCLSASTIQRLFENEPGVVTLGDKSPRGKRRRITLRIPRSVMERVKKRRSNV